MKGVFNVDAIPPLSDHERVVHAIIEIPKGRRNKFEMVKKFGLIKLDRYLFSASHYPGDYGFLPQTLAADDDALDILVMVNEPTFSGCLIEARVIGMFTMLDRGKDDHKLLAVPNTDPLYADCKSLEDVPKHFLKEVEHFFATYKQLEGTEVTPGPWHEAGEAMQVIDQSIKAYRADKGFE